MTLSIPSLSQAFSGLMSALTPKAAAAPNATPVKTYSSLQPAVPRTSAPIVGVSSPSALAAAGMGQNYSSLSSRAPAVPTLPAPTTSYSSLAVPNASYSTLAPTGKTYSSTTSPTAPNATSSVTGQPVYIPPGQTGAPNATSAVTGKPTYAAPTVPTVPKAAPAPTIAPSGAVAAPSSAPAVPVAPAGAPAAPASEAPAAPLAVANIGNAGSTGNYSGSAGGAPGAGPATPSFEDAYLKSLTPTSDEEDAQKQLDALAEAAGNSFVNIQNQPIALPFITGQQAAVERSRANLAVPLEARLTRLQAKRQISMEASKAALDRADKQAEKSKPISVGATETLVDPTTGLPIYSGAGLAGGTTAATDSWTSLIKNGQASLSDVPTDLRTAVADAMAGSPVVSKKNKDAISQAGVVVDYIDNADSQIGPLTTGVIGVGSAMIPGTPAYNLARTIDTIRANVGFQALQAMRDASPTGGALGQVSEQENKLLQSTLGSLDIGQGEAQLRANMAKVKQHFNNMIKVLGADPKATVSYDAQGNVVIGGAGSGGSTGNAASEGWF